MRCLFVCLLFIYALSAKCQEPPTGKPVVLPDIAGYRTLKCDFHMHTVFSDGHVWPTFRVNEAVRDGLDAISLTEHIDFEGFPEVIDKNYNKSFEIAAEAAKKTSLLVIRGVEISPRVPPYHNNALFVKDANRFPIDYMKTAKKKFIMQDTPKHDQLMAPFLEAQQQDAFVFYNHPGYSWWDKKDTNIFTGFHEELLEKKILKGVEVVNSGRYNIIAHRIAMKYNLTMMCNTDEHYDMAARYQKTHRPMTLVFAKTKSEAAIREALESKRTALFFDEYLIARQPEAEAFFKAAVEVKSEYKTRNGEKILQASFINRSSIPFDVRFSADYDIENYPLGQVRFRPLDTSMLILKAVWKMPAEMTVWAIVNNIVISPEEPLTTSFLLKPERERQYDSITVMTYNIHHANPQSVKDSIDIDAVAKVIIKEHPDLVALQEVDVHTDRSGRKLDEAAYLAKRTGMKVYFGKAIPLQGGAYGVAILSRFPLSDMKTNSLPTLSGTGGEPRVLATATVDIGKGRKILFACTHLDAGRTDTNRLLQIRAVTDLLKASNLPVVLAGDLNSDPESRVISILDSQLTRSCTTGCDFTFPEVQPRGIIDYIAFKPRGSFVVRRHWVVAETYASDHRPVMATMEIH